MQAVILAGGLGSRLRPLTLNRPKPITPLCNIPFLRYQLALLRAHGVEEVILSVSHLPDVIRAVMEDGASEGVQLRYVVEQEPLGTAGGFRNAAGLVKGRVVVLNGDILTDLDLSAMVRFHEARGARATICLTRVEDPTLYGVVELEANGRVRRFLEKPSPDEVTTDTINAGTYLIEAELLDLIPPGVVYSMERQFFPDLLARNVAFYGWVSDAYWLDIGTAQKYCQANRDLMSRQIRLPVSLLGTAGTGAWVGDPSHVAESAKLLPPVVISAGCRIGERAQVGPFTVLGAGTTVGADSVVVEAICWEEVSLGESVHLHGSLLGKGCRIGNHAWLGPVVLGDGAMVPPYSRA